MKIILIILSMILMLSCTKPPKEGCLDTAADNYNSESENNCCCVYSAWIKFNSDTLNINNYIYKINGNWAEVYSKYYIGKPTTPLIPYQIYNRADSTLFTQSSIQLYPGKTSNIKF